jgi:hypothetical protein
LTDAEGREGEFEHMVPLAFLREISDRTGREEFLEIVESRLGASSTRRSRYAIAAKSASRARSKPSRDRKGVVGDERRIWRKEK